MIGRRLARHLGVSAITENSAAVDAIPEALITSMRVAHSDSV